MPLIPTREAAIEILTSVMPAHRGYRARTFEHGWVLRAIHTNTEAQQGLTVGSPAYVVDSETGYIYMYPSWAVTMVIKAYLEYKQTGHKTAGRQIYPYQWQISPQKLREDDQTIEYQMTARSLTDPPEPTIEHPITLEKDGYRNRPTDSMSAAEASHVRWIAMNRNKGSWPQTDQMQR